MHVIYSKKMQKFCIAKMQKSCLPPFFFVNLLFFPNLNHEHNIHHYFSAPYAGLGNYLLLFNDMVETYGYNHHKQYVLFPVDLWLTSEDNGDYHHHLF